MYFMCATHYKSISDPIPHRIPEGKEAVGILLQVLELEGFAVAVFSWGAISLPGEFAARLRELIGKRISILRINGYHVRDLDGRPDA